MTAKKNATAAATAPVVEQTALEAKLERWVAAGECPRAGHAIASVDDLYVVPSSGNVQCRECRKEIRRSYKDAVKSGEHTPVPFRFHPSGPRVLVTLDGTPDRVRAFGSERG